MSEIQIHFNVEIKDEFHEMLVKKALQDTIEDCLETCAVKCEKHAVEFIHGQNGHPQRIDTGRLVGSIDHETLPNENAVIVGTNVEYAPYVHEGTSRMAPNRFLRDAIEDYKDEYRSVFQDALK